MYADDRVIVAEHREEMRGALVSKLQTKVISKLQNNVILNKQYIQQLNLLKAVQFKLACFKLL